MSNQLEIIHLKQRHRSKGNMLWENASEKDREAVVFNQYNIAKYIIDKNYGSFWNPIKASYLILNEGATKTSDMDDDYQSNGEICQQINKYFSSGIPSGLAEISKIQKSLMYHYGAARILLCNQYIDKFYKTTNEKLLMKRRNEFDQIDQKIKDNAFSSKEDAIYYRNKLLAGQEKSVIKYCKLAQEKHNSENLINITKVFLIFGAAHDFSQECNDFRYNLTEISFVEKKSTSIFGFPIIGAEIVEKNIIEFPNEVVGQDSIVNYDL